jgi:protocatechuate 3,4-dioxygenase beta subunit
MADEIAGDMPGDIADDISGDMPGGDAELRDVTERTLRSFDAAPDERLRFLLQSLVTHLHGFVREAEPTVEEWKQAIAFLTATGQKCDDLRQEFILLSDVLGVSSLVETVNHRVLEAETAQTVLGPFHVVESPPRELGDNICLTEPGEPCVVVGRVLARDGSPVPGARIDTWAADHDGFYDVQRPGEIPELNLRGLFTTDELGRFWFRTEMPHYYPIPTDGPVGALLNASGRHPYRPAHIHLIAEASGYEPVTTHIFAADSPYLDSDAVFGVKDSLIREFELADDPDRAAGYRIANPFRYVEFDLVLRG